MKIWIATVAAAVLTGCLGNMNPTGNNRTPGYPFYVTQAPLKVKQIHVPAGTKLVYEESFLSKGAQPAALSERDLIEIQFPEQQPHVWAGVPVLSISRFFNSSMRGFSLKPARWVTSGQSPTPFAQLWRSCDSDLGVMIASSEDWSFNKSNVTDISSCSVVFQRYFKNDKVQQDFLDRIYRELQQVNSR